MDAKIQIQAALARALQAAHPDADLPEPGDIQLSPPRQRGHGDLSTNVAMALAKALGKPPREIAQAICDRLQEHEAIESVEVAGPGFINITLRTAAAARVLHRIATEGERFGTSDIGQGKRVNVEFVSANPTGPLHVGHARNAVVGDTIARLLERNGFDVTREYYFNDEGLQMALLGYSIRARVIERLGLGQFEDEVPRDGYFGRYLLEFPDHGAESTQRVKSRITEELAEQLLKFCELARGQGDELSTDKVAGAVSEKIWGDLIADVPEVLRAKFQAELNADLSSLVNLTLVHSSEQPRDIIRRFLNRPPYKGNRVLSKLGGSMIMQWIRRDLAGLGVRLDEFTYESRFHTGVAGEAGKRGSSELERVISELERRDEVYPKDRAKFLKSSKYGDEKDRVVRKRDGSYTYFAPDIAYHADKFRRGFDRLIDVFGADHHGYVPRLRAAIQALGHDADALDVVIIQLVNILKDGEVQRLGKRLGNFITLRQMLDELGPDVIRWFFLMRSADSDMTFDWALAQDHSERNPVYKVQYAHARICSVFGQAAKRGIEFAGVESTDLDLLAAAEEQALLQHLSQFPDVVRRAVETLGPHIVPAYLLDLANLYNAYQTLGRKDGRFRILRPDAPAETQARLALVDAVRTVLRNGLTLLGIHSPERM